MLRKLWKGVKSKVAAVVGGAGAAAVATTSYAALDLTGVAIDTAPVFSLATIIITAIAGIWAIKKVIKLGNRS